jgi:hypothetical protein
MIKQIFKYLKASFVIGIREGASANAGKPQMIPTRFVDVQSRYNVPDAVFLLDLREQNRDILLPGRIGLYVSVSLVLLYGFFELISRYKFQQFSEDRFQLAHGLFLLVIIGFGRILLSNKRGSQAMPF